MAASLKDVLAVQGVIPVSAGAPPPSTAGLSLGQLTGVWITGAPAAAPAAGGLTIGQLTGVWIDGAVESTPVVTPVVPPVEDKSVSGTSRKAKSDKFERPILQLNQPLEQRSVYSQLYAEDEELISLVLTMVKLGML